MEDEGRICLKLCRPVVMARDIAANDLGEAGFEEHHIEILHHQEVEARPSLHTIVTHVQPTVVLSTRAAGLEPISGPPTLFTVRRAFLPSPPSIWATMDLTTHEIRVHG